MKGVAWSWLLFGRCVYLKQITVHIILKHRNLKSVSSLYIAARRRCKNINVHNYIHVKNVKTFALAVNNVRVNISTKWPTSSDFWQHSYTPLIHFSTYGVPTVWRLFRIFILYRCITTMIAQIWRKIFMYKPYLDAEGSKSCAPHIPPNFTKISKFWPNLATFVAPPGDIVPQFAYC